MAPPPTSSYAYWTTNATSGAGAIAACSESSPPGGSYALLVGLWLGAAALAAAAAAARGRAVLDAARDAANAAMRDRAGRDDDEIAQAAEAAAAAAYAPASTAAHVRPGNARRCETLWCCGGGGGGSCNQRTPPQLRVPSIANVVAATMSATALVLVLYSPPVEVGWVMLKVLYVVCACALFACVAHTAPVVALSMAVVQWGISLAAYFLGNYVHRGWGAPPPSAPWEFGLLVAFLALELLLSAFAAVGRGDPERGVWMLGAMHSFVTCTFLTVAVQLSLPVSASREPAVLGTSPVVSWGVLATMALTVLLRGLLWAWRIAQTRERGRYAMFPFHEMDALEDDEFEDEQCACSYSFASSVAWLLLGLGMAVVWSSMATQMLGVAEELLCGGGPFEGSVFTLMNATFQGFAFGTLVVSVWFAVKVAEASRQVERELELEALVEEELEERRRRTRGDRSRVDRERARRQPSRGYSQRRSLPTTRQLLEATEEGDETAEDPPHPNHDHGEAAPVPHASSATLLGFRRSVSSGTGEGGAEARGSLLRFGTGVFSGLSVQTTAASRRRQHGDDVYGEGAEIEMEEGSTTASPSAATQYAVSAACPGDVTVSPSRRSDVDVV